MGHSLLTPKLAKLETIILASFCLRLQEMRMNGSLPSKGIYLQTFSLEGKCYVLDPVSVPTLFSSSCGLF